MCAHAKRKNSVGASDRTCGRVLLITDEDVDSYVEALVSRGIEVVGVSNGSAAFVSLQRSRPHVVVANPSARGLRVNEFGRLLAISYDGIPLVMAGQETAMIQGRRSSL